MACQARIEGRGSPHASPAHTHLSYAFQGLVREVECGKVMAPSLTGLCLHWNIRLFGQDVPVERPGKESEP